MWAVFLIIALLAALLILREFVMMVIPMIFAEISMRRGNLDLAGKILARLTTTPALFSGKLKSHLRERLAGIYLEKGRPEEAVAFCRQALTLRRIKPLVEWRIRQRLADCLEAAGDTKQAEAERQQAGRLLAEAPDNFHRSVARAMALDKEGRYQEAYVAYTQVLARIPAHRSQQRAQLLARLALVSYNAGQPPEQTIQWAEEAMKIKPPVSLRLPLHATVALGYVSSGDLEAAEKHRKEALQLAVASRNPQRTAEAMVQLASVQQYRGKLMEAIQTCEKAAGLSLKARRNALVTHAECLRHWGRFDDAKELLFQAKRAPGYSVPARERRSQAILSLGLAWIEADTNRVEEATRYLEEAATELSREPKLTLMCLSTEVWISALSGRAQETERALERLEAQMAAFAQNRSVLLGCYAMAGRATLLLADYIQCKHYWEMYLALNPHPVDQPMGRTYLGECLLHLGDHQAAKSMFQEAVAWNIDTHYARRAQRQWEALISGRCNGG